jgi:N-acetylmuramoyl-L-alanine amidase
MKKAKIAIDAGHGSDTAGKRTPPFTANVDINGDGKIDIKKGTSYREHYANVGVANQLYKELVSRGYEVIKTGWDDIIATDDKDESLSSRQAKIKKAKCDYSISIHFNAYGDGKSFNSANGTSVYIHTSQTADSRKLAEYVLQELVKGTEQTNRGVHGASLSMCNCKSMNTTASILCELAFMTNKHEAMKLMANETYWKECAREIADAVDRYCNCENVEETKKNVISNYRKVKKGETLSEIALEEGTTVERLVELNSIKNPNKISIGQKLVINKYSLYTIKKGDTLSDISLKILKDARYVKDIKELNNLSSDTIFVNQILKIPVL